MKRSGLSLEKLNHQYIAALFLSILFCIAPTSSVFAEHEPDYEREGRIAEQIIGDIFDGETVWLKANDHSFLAIHTFNEVAPKGTVIILHGRGYHPDWQEVAGPLRTGLIGEGWSTLSLQMPVLEKGKSYYDYMPLFKFAGDRIESAIAIVRKSSDQPVILAAHSCGAHMANDWLNNGDDSKIDGYIIMGAGATDFREGLETPFPFAKMRVPILDIYGEYEYSRPLAMLPERKTLLDAGGHPGSRQLMLPGVDHYFHGAGEQLTEAVANWLNTTSFYKQRTITQTITHDR